MYYTFFIWLRDRLIFVTWPAFFQDLMLVNQSPGAAGAEEVQRQRRQRQRLIAQLDQFIASECVLCGNIAVEAIDKPFYEEGDTGGWL